MHTLSLLAVSLCCAVAWAQSDPADTLPADPIDEQSQGEIFNADASRWSLKDIARRDITVYWENDGTVPNLVSNTDRFYTNGFGVELSFDPGFSDELKAKLAPAGEWTDPRFGFGLSIKQRIFTGVDITDPAPAVGDHPYSGYLYFGFSFQRADAKKHDHFELDLGVVGERSQAEAVQRFVHNLFPDQDTPQGWSSQHANELTINFSYDRTWKSEPGTIAGVEFEMLPSVGFDLGNVSTRARSRLTFRAGYNIPDDFGPASLLGFKDHTISRFSQGDPECSIYAYFTLGVDAVAHSIFLEGNTFATSRSVDSEPLLAQAKFGVAARYKAFYLGWSQSFETESYESQPDAQTWGSLVVGCSFGY
ncbi:hypothetical protein COB72_07760 [bacterium]|nr:MAG: hypothetical protein COB72_07760 [bacterium]